MAKNRRWYEYMCARGKFNDEFEVKKDQVSPQFRVVVASGDDVAPPSGQVAIVHMVEAGGIGWEVYSGRRENRIRKVPVKAGVVLEERPQGLCIQPKKLGCIEAKTSYSKGGPRFVSGWIKRQKVSGAHPRQIPRCIAPKGSLETPELRARYVGWSAGEYTGASALVSWGA